MPTILIAEDNDDLRDLLAQYLRANGYRAVGAVDGYAAVSRHWVRRILTLT